MEPCHATADFRAATPPSACPVAWGTAMTRFFASAILLTAALCWGAGNVANKTVLDHLAPTTVVGLRCALGAAAIAPFAFRDMLRRGDAGWWRSAVSVALLFALALILQQIAYQSTTVTNASFLVNTATLLTPLMGWAVLGYRPGKTIACAAPLTLLGAFLMAGAGVRPSDYNTGDLVALASAVVYAAWMLALGQHAATHGRPLATALIQFGTASLLILPVGLWQAPPSLQDLTAAAPELLMLGLVSTALAFGLMTWAQRYVAASTAAILTSAESLFGAAGGFLLLAERPAPIAVLGAGLILLGIVLVALADQSPPPRAAKPAAPSLSTSL